MIYKIEYKLNYVSNLQKVLNAATNFIKKIKVPREVW